MIEVKCDNCGNTCLKYKYNLKYKRHFCNKSCYSQFSRIGYKCHYCKKSFEKVVSNYYKNKRHFCSCKCHSLFRKEILPKEEQPAYRNGGMSEQEKKKRIKARCALNHAVRDKRLKKLPCEICNDKKSEGHHHNYNKALKVTWLCKKCHWQEHKMKIIASLNLNEIIKTYQNKLKELK